MIPPHKIRVLVVDDSAFVRKLVTEALALDPQIEVVGTATDPLIARDKILTLKPDVLTLDIEMPRMDGLTYLKEIMETKPMPVIIMSSLSKTGSQQALEALRLGAVDVIGKPGGTYSFGNLGPQLCDKIKAASVARVRIRPPSLAWASKPNASPATAPANPASRPTPPAAAPIHPMLRALDPVRRNHPRRVILLGASTGGTEALREVLTHLPGDLPGMAIVQHIPAIFSKAFADRLNAQCACEVREAVDGERLAPGLALIAPGNYHMLLQWAGDGYRVRLNDGPQVWHQRPAVDLLFRSAADSAGAYAIAGVLTGMGKDGAEGLLRLREKGAATFSQDEESSVVYGMPRVAWELGGSQRQVHLDHVATCLTTLVDTPVAASATTPRASF